LKVEISNFSRFEVSTFKVESSNILKQEIWTFQGWRVLFSKCEVPVFEVWKFQFQGLHFFLRMIFHYFFGVVRSIFLFYMAFSFKWRRCHRLWQDFLFSHDHSFWQMMKLETQFVIQKIITRFRYKFHDFSMNFPWPSKFHDFSRFSRKWQPC
jgi:hypothetical protein